MKCIAKFLAVVALLLSPNSQFSRAFAQGTAFTYQGRLNIGAIPASGSYDLTFGLFSVSNGVGQVGVIYTNSATAVSNGLFNVTLDFGLVFDGPPRWLEISARTNGGGAFTTLSPRQALTATPYAITAGMVTGSVAASNLNGTVSLAQLPAAVVTNGATGVSVTGSFTGNGAGLTNVSTTHSLVFNAQSLVNGNTFTPDTSLHIQGAAQGTAAIPCFALQFGSAISLSFNVPLDFTSSPAPQVIVHFLTANNSDAFASVNLTLQTLFAPASGAAFSSLSTTYGPIAVAVTTPPVSTYNHYDAAFTLTDTIAPEEFAMLTITRSDGLPAILYVTSVEFRY